MKKLINAILSRLRVLVLRKFGFLNDDPESNGEYSLLDRLVRSSERRKLVLFDIGANCGDWTHKAIITAKERSLELHAFEPGREAYKLLCSRSFQKVDKLVLNNIAVDRISGVGVLEVSQANDKLSYLVQHPCCLPLNGSAKTDSHREGVATISVDQYCRSKNIETIFFMKIDVEGAELAVLNGCANMLREGRILNVQFEYWGTYLRAGTKLTDVVGFLRTFGYRVGRIMPRSIKWLNDLKAQQDSYRYSNYFATRGLTPMRAFRYYEYFRRFKV